MKDKIDMYLKLLKEIREEAYSVLKWWNENIKQIDGYKYLSFDYADEYDVVFTGVETWNYGGYQDYEFCFSIKLLYDEEEKSKIMERAKIKRQQKEIKKREQKEKQDREKEQRERSLLAELKSKYEKE